MKALRSYWPHVLLLVAVVGLVSVTRAWAGALGRADAAEVRADSLSGVVASLAAENEARFTQLLARDSAYSADSIRWAADRASQSAQASVARERAQETAGVLRARLDSIGAALLGEYEAEVGREREAARQMLESVSAELAVMHERVAERDALIDQLFAEIDVRESEVAEVRAANHALRNAIAPGFTLRVWNDLGETVAACGAASLLAPDDYRLKVGLGCVGGKLLLEAVQ